MRYRKNWKGNFCMQRLLEKVSLCLHFQLIRRGSFVVEAAAVLPVFLLGILAMVSLMDVWALQTSHLMRACESAKEQAIDAWNQEHVTEVQGIEAWVYHPIGGILPLPSLGMRTEVTAHTWNGAGFGSEDDVSGEAEEMVYVALHGSVYHTDASCSYLSPAVHSMAGSDVESARNDAGGKYYPCETCSWHQNPGTIVYVTNTGTRYHNLGSCTRIEHTYQLVPLSQVSGLSICSRCKRRH